MVRKELDVNPATLYVLLGYGNDECDGFKMVDDEIIHSDAEDGGADHDYVIKEVSTGDFYKGSYTDWDIYNTDYNEDDHLCEDRVDFHCKLKQVFPKVVEKTIYE